LNQANLLLLNTGATVTRMAASVVLGLWTTRIAYQELGRDGFGAYAAALAVVVMLPILIEAFSASAQRHMAHAIGAADAAEVRAVSATFVTMSLAGAMLLAVVVVAAAPWLAEPLKAEPPHTGRLPAAMAWIGVMTAFVLAQTPYRSYLIAKQSIALLTVYEMLESFARVAAAASLFYYAQPTIIDYARNTALAVAALTVALAVWCTCRYPVTRPGRLTRVGLIAGMGLWIIVSQLGWKIRTHGIQVAINTLVGAAATASYSVSLQLALYQHSLSASVYRAVRPALVSAQGRGTHNHVRQLAVSLSKLISIGTLIASVPLFFETRAILTYWIGDATDEMVMMTRWIVAWMSIKDLTLGHITAVHASGRVALHEVLFSSFDVLALVVGCLAVWYGAPAWSFPCAVFFSIIGYSVVTVTLFADVARLTPAQWARLILAPYVAVATIVGLVTAVLVATIEPSLGRLVLVVMVTPLVVALAAYAVGFDDEERRRLGDAFGAVMRRVRRRSV
jgi:O-antigen/teichoic acid export membrane protein